ncbi:MAG TPA: xanthine dehydrogenase family protein subunit M, partial [Candidatus Limnocylindrales bacterium]|nr:xanthine dehydrogenase family protein subunit M [Candidatus Limnocylindrales bacterium]
KVLAGGQSLLPLMKIRLAHPETLVDIGRLTELKGITKLEDGRLAIGALTTYTELLDSPAVHYGVLRDALPTIGDVQVRNRGTVGGSVAHADPASDLPAALLALGAEIVLRSPAGSRTVPADGFFQGPFQTAARHDELLTQVILPAPRDNAGSAYTSLEQPASGYALVGVAAVLIVGAGGVVEYAGVGVTGVSEHPYRASDVEAALVGTTASPEVIAAAAASVIGDRPVNSDIHANAEYRSAMAVVYTRRALSAALARVG